MIFSAQELWGDNPTGLVSTLNYSSFYVYIAVMLSAIFSVNVIDCSRICSKKSAIVFNSLASIVMDLGLLSLWEAFMLLTIGKLPSDTLNAFSSILLVASPWALGVISLSTLTVDYLRRRTEKLQKEIEKLKKQAESLEKSRQEGEKDSAEYERRKRELLECFKETKAGE